MLFLWGEIMPKKKSKKKSVDTLKKKVGRPKKYADTEVEVFEKKIEDYFKECDSKDRPYTFSGLALALDFLDVKTLRTYGKDEKFFPSVNRARMRILEQYERELFRSQGSTQGVQFALKNNFFEYKDEQTVNQNVQGSLTIEEYLKDKQPKL